jgi:hypothetical protein
MSQTRGKSKPKRIKSPKVPEFSKPGTATMKNPVLRDPPFVLG